MDINTNLITAKKVSEYLSIPLRTIHRLSKQGRIKSFKIGGKWFYQKSEIEKYLQYGTSFGNSPDRINNDSLERREYPRINTHIECVYSIDLPEKSAERKAIIKNISAGGSLLTDDNLCPSIDDPVCIRFRLFDNILEAGARVVRKTGKGFAIKFRNIDKFQQEEIIRYVG